MDEHNHRPSGLGALLKGVARTGMGALRNRGELFAVEWQIERVRLMEMFFYAGSLICLAFMGLGLLTLLVVFLFPEDQRLWALGGFAILYGAGALGAWIALRAALKREPFSESLAQTRKDAAWLESLK